MVITDIHLVYFSATYTTRKIARAIAEQIGSRITRYDITNELPAGDILLDKKDELLVVGVPVYAGRIPPAAAKALAGFKGADTPAIVVGVYGNRDYDDAILELRDVVEANGFKTIAAGAFIAQHSIFPAVATHRPDERDVREIGKFAQACKDKIADIENIRALPRLKVKGNTPYKIPKGIPIHPVGKKKTCNQCGVCAKQCPAKAIPQDEPYKTNRQTCISCGRCIVICPQKSRRFKGLLYKIAGWKFTKDNSKRKEPECFL